MLSGLVVRHLAPPCHGSIVNRECSVCSHVQGCSGNQRRLRVEVSPHIGFDSPLGLWDFAQSHVHSPCPDAVG